MHFVIGTLSNCCLLYKVQLQHVTQRTKPGFGGLTDVKVSLQNFSDMCLLKIIKFGWHLANLLHTVKGHFLKQCKHM